MSYEKYIYIYIYEFYHSATEKEDLKPGLPWVFIDRIYFEKKIITQFS